MKFYRNVLICLLASLFFITTNGICNKAKPEKIYSLRKITMSKEWYAEQAVLWKMEIDKNPSNPDAWYNYYQACRYAIQLSLPVSSVNSIKRPEEIIKEMGKTIPESFEYHLVKEELLDKPVEKIRALEEAYKMRPQDPRTYYSLISLYERTRQLKKVKEFCEKLYESRDYPSSLLDYNYNVLVSVEKNGILFTNGDNDTFPIQMLQHVKNIREDVLVLNIHEAQDLIYLDKKMRENDLRLNIEEFHKFDLKILIEQIHEKTPDRKIYIAVTVDTRPFKSFLEQLYCIGLVYQFSQKRVDNVALIAKHMEKKYRLDSLDYDWYSETTISAGKEMASLNFNYVYPLLMLTEHYDLSGAHERAKYWMGLVKRLAEASGKEDLIDYLKKK